MSSTPRVSFNANKKGSEWYAGPKKNFINQFERSVQSTKLLSFQFCGKSDLVFQQIQFILQLWLQSNLCISVFLSVSTICNYPPICQSILLIVVSLHMSYCISLFFFGLSIIIVLSILCLFIYLSTFLPKVFYFFITSTKKFPNTTDGSAKDFSKRALPGLLSFFVFTVDSKFHLPVSGFEPVISCIRSDRSTNCTTNTALEVLQLVHYTFAIITVHSDWTQTTADSVVDCVKTERKSSIFPQVSTRCHSVKCSNQCLNLLHQRTLTIGGRITAWPVSSLTRLDLTKKENMLPFVWSAAVDS